MEKIITYPEFLDSYGRGELNVSINKRKVGGLVLSKYANKYNKPAHLFWTWVSFILLIPLPIIFVFFNWFYSIIALFWGLILMRSSKKSACQFVLENMLSDENFCIYVISKKGARIMDYMGNEYIIVK